MYRRSCRTITALRQALSTMRGYYIDVGKGQLCSVMMVMMPHQLVNSYRRFGETCCLNLLDLSYHSNVTSLKHSRASRFWKKQSQNEDFQNGWEASSRTLEARAKERKKEIKKEKVKIRLFCSALSGGSPTSCAYPSDKSRIKIKMRVDHWWILILILKAKNQSTRRRTCTSTTLSPKNVTRSSPGRPAFKHAINRSNN